MRKDLDMADLVVFGASKPSSPGTSRRVWLVAVAGWLPFNQKSEEYVQGIFDHGKHALETIGHTVVVSKFFIICPRVLVRQ